ncbi:GntR family transcriptional regulator [Oceanobacillus sp. 143]|uniref:GntR family transcriptional regulator n=1 Tax=Oceanobacillus zhaokaii TaxID=2052660 RepID=A0A345PEH7_9BACI|nr:GntR family transcriptional regulator [Oceanobacillus zhaokaii]AXI08407.1 GntR family transcriptional regulator [Oceanobacillus zhaokaii]QGS68278.1 GntR family transcriptional regulator [Oceanobacillus sp. 143]
MFININLESAEPIYIQLQHQIIEGIAKGKLKPGDPLPSVRSLASDIGINLHTVNKVYQLLKQDGYILIHRQKGVVINPEGPPKADEEYKQNLKASIHPLIAASICRGIEEEAFLQMCKELFNEFKEEGENK